VAAPKKTISQPKPRYHHGDLRRALIDASLALIAEEGFSALTLREVARRAGVTHAAPYRHFADKEALLAAVAEEGFRSMAAEMRARMDQQSQPAERLIACGVAYVLFAVRHPSHFRVMFGPHFPRPSKHEGLSTEGGSGFALLVQCLTQGQQAGVLRAGDTLSLALTSWSLVHGLASLLVDGMLEPMAGPAVEPEALAVAQTRLLLEGLRVRPQNG
jgi:AcrR family transcriptional regulator